MQRALHAGALLCGVASAGSAQAETLAEAWTHALASSPVYATARADILGAEAARDIARAAGRPNLSADASVEATTGSRNDFSAPNLVRGTSLSLQLPLFQGGRVREGVRAARARIDAREADLRAQEGDLMVSVVTAFVDVIRTGRVAELNHRQIDVLGQEVAATRARLRHGDGTRTDVAQALARQAAARGQAALADAEAVAARESYARVIGHLPGDLVEPAAAPPLPPSPDDALAVALRARPELIAAKATVVATVHDRAAARAERLPRIGFVGSGGYGNQSNNVRGSRFDLRVGLSLTVPLFQGGRVAARVRQATAQQASAQEDAVRVERAVVAQVRTAFARRVAGGANILATDAARVASAQAARSIREELKAGDRDYIDVLNADQEALNAQVAYVNARSDTLTASAELYRAIGRPTDLLLASAPSAKVDGGKVLEQGLAFDLRGLHGSRVVTPAPPAAERHAALTPLAFDLRGLG